MEGKMSNNQCSFWRKIFKTKLKTNEQRDTRRDIGTKIPTNKIGKAGQVWALYSLCDIGYLYNTSSVPRQ